MSKRNFFIGMGMGLMVGSAAAWALTPKRRNAKKLLNQTLKTMGEAVDSVNDMMGW